MNRIDRLNALLIHLQSKSSISINELERRFEVSRRTIFRDIKSLLSAGVPIGGNAGEGYFIVEGYHLPPVVFDKQEASALLLGAKFIEKSADSNTIEAFQKAMYKVKAVLKESDKTFLEKIDKKISIILSQQPPRRNDFHIAVIQQAIVAHELVRIHYYAQHTDSHSQRDVEPLGMVYYSGKWHLIAYCRLRKELRDFRADRIENAKPLGERIYPEQHPNYLDFVNDRIKGTDAKEVVIRCSKFAARFMTEQKYFLGFKEEKHLENGKIQMKFIVNSYSYFIQWLFSFGNEVEIVSPSEVIGMAAQQANSLMEYYRNCLLKTTPE